MREPANVDTVLSFLIAIGIVGFGFWAMTKGIARSDWPAIWSLLGMMPVIVGLISLYFTICEVKTG